MKIRMILIIILFQIILLSSFTEMNIYPATSLTTHDTMKASQNIETTPLPSILRIGVAIPEYHYEYYERFFDPVAIGWNIDYLRNSIFYIHWSGDRD